MLTIEHTNKKMIYMALVLGAIAEISLERLTHVHPNCHEC